MAMPTGTLKWGTLARMSDLEVYRYFRDVREQAASHAENSLRLLRASRDATGSRHARPLHPSSVELDHEVRSTIAADKGLPLPAPREPKSTIIVQEDDSGITVTLPASEPDEPDEPTAASEPARPAFEATVDEGALGQKDPAGAALAAMIAPHMLGQLAPAIRLSVEHMHAELAKNAATRLVVVRDNARKTLEGTHHAAAPKVIQLAGQGLNVMLVGPAGCGKTVLASSVAKAYERPLTCVSCSAGMSEAQLMGRLLPLGEGGTFQYVESPFVRAYREGAVILLDEMDAADANLLLVINAALANNAVEIEARAASGLDVRVERHPDTVIIAAANTWGAGADTQYIGRGALDVSTLDRFYRLAIDYDEALERQLGTPDVVSFVQVLRRKARAAKLRRVVSTRMITRMSAAIDAGIPFKEAVRDELASWTADERAKVGES